MAGRGRTPGFRMTEEHRVKIQNSNILNALIEHVTGDREMSASQVTAGLGLLRKVLPDLTQVDSKAEVVHKYVARAPTPAKTVDEWMNRVKPNGITTIPRPEPPRPGPPKLQ